MKVIFIRHADAESAGDGSDADRRLTERGRRQSKTTAEALRAMDLTLEAVFTSPLVRSAETAEIVAGVHGDAPVETAEELAPPGDSRALRERLAELARRGVGAVALIGHTPSLEQCLAAMITGGAPAAMGLTKAGAACAEWGGDGGVATLVWLMRREQLKTIAEAEKK